MFRRLPDANPPALSIEIDGVSMIAYEGETVAAVLLRQNDVWNRTTPISSAKRAPFCMMGVCFDCLANVDGVGSTQTCLTTVRNGMIVKRQIGGRELSE